MPTSILLHPDLGVSPEEFVAAWNGRAEAHELAQASLERQPQASFGFGEVVAMLSGVAIGVATNALYDLIKETILMRGVRKRIEVVERVLPDGTRVITVTGMEE